MDDFLLFAKGWSLIYITRLIWSLKNFTGGINILCCSETANYTFVQVLQVQIHLSCELLSENNILKECQKKITDGFVGFVDKM